MAVFTVIPDEVLEPGKPARSVDAIALRDNPIAIAEGALGAPKVVTAALASSSVTTVKIVDLNVTTSKLANASVTSAKLASGTAERDWVGARVAAIPASAVGQVALVMRGNTSTNYGSAIAGSSIRPGGIEFSGTNSKIVAYGLSLPGTWRFLGATSNAVNTSQITFAMRIS